MDFHHHSNEIVLSALVGPKTAAKLLEATSGCLAPLIAENLAAYRIGGNTINRVAAAKALVLRAIEETLQARDLLSSPTQVRQYLQISFAGLEHEVFSACFLNAHNHLLAAETLFRGTLTETSVYPREIVKRALFHNAAGVIFAHNHPSGAPAPSVADKQLTERLQKALQLIDVRVLDHVIIADNTCFSFAEGGLI
jgi:DNA repair protein RadC